MPRLTVQLSQQADTNEADLTRAGRADLTKSTITRERATLGERNKKNKNTWHYRQRRVGRRGLAFQIRKIKKERDTNRNLVRDPAVSADRDTVARL